jgi:hypothetical protein
MTTLGLRTPVIERMKRLTSEATAPEGALVEGPCWLWQGSVTAAGYGHGPPRGNRGGPPHCWNPGDAAHMSLKPPRPQPPAVPRVPSPEPSCAQDIAARAAILSTLHDAIGDQLKRLQEGPRRQGPEDREGGDRHPKISVSLDETRAGHRHRQPRPAKAAATMTDADAFTAWVIGNFAT